MAGKFIGRACMVACKQWHDLPADFTTPFKGQYQSHADLTPTTWNLIKMKERTDASGRFHWDFIKFQCMHCENPACMLGCPEGAISKKDSGAVVIDEDKCVGCGYCRTNCPFNVPRHEKSFTFCHWINAISFLMLFLTALPLYADTFLFLYNIFGAKTLQYAHRFFAMIFIFTPIIGLLSARKGYGTLFKQAFSFGMDDLIFLLTFPVTLFGIEPKMPKIQFAPR